MPIRPMDSILADEPSIHTLPDGPQSDSATTEPAAEPVSEAAAEGEKPEAKVETKPTVKPAPVTGPDDDDPEDIDPVDQSLDGLKRALSASRGDKRKLKKQWREAEKRVEDTARRIALLEGQLTAYQHIGQRPQPVREQPKTPEAPKLPDFFGSPEEHLTARERVLLEKFEADKRALREEISSSQFKRDATRSEKRMLREKQDYKDAKAAVVRMHGEASPFWTQLLNDPEPAELVYEEGKRILRGGKSEREAELEAELEALKAAQATASVTASTTSAPKPTARPIPKPSIAGARGTGNGVKHSWSGPRSLDEIIGR